MNQINVNIRKFKEINGSLAIYDYLRKKYVILTPEEEVRQKMIDYLIFIKKYSKSLIKLESGLQYNSLAMRSDILVFDNHGHPLLLIECKSKDVKIDQKVIEQASRYNLIINARYVCITNSLSTFCFEKIDSKYQQISDIPEFIIH